jgi:hypothetical protein
MDTTRDGSADPQRADAIIGLSRAPAITTLERDAAPPRDQGIARCCYDVEETS